MAKKFAGFSDSFIVDAAGGAVTISYILYYQVVTPDHIFRKLVGESPSVRFDE